MLSISQDGLFDRWATEVTVTRKKGGIPGLSFCWKRAIGLSSAKAKLSKELGVPLTRQGRQRKVGGALGYCVPFVVVFGTMFGVGFALLRRG